MGKLGSGLMDRGMHGWFSRSVDGRVQVCAKRWCVDGGNEERMRFQSSVGSPSRVQITLKEVPKTLRNGP